MVGAFFVVVTFETKTGYNTVGSLEYPEICMYVGCLHNLLRQLKITR